MSTAHTPSRKQVSARRRLAVAVVPGVIAGAVSTTLVNPLLALLIGWEVLAAVYLGSLWYHIHQHDAAQTARHATSEDPGIPLTDTLLTFASLASLGAVVGIMATPSPGTSWPKIIQLVAVLIGLALSWLIIHSVFMLRYARLYYTGQHGGIDFNQSTAPCYSDFAYLAFTLGMTFQVSDTNINSSRVRRTALAHALFSYLFGTIILASAINLIVNLSH